MKWCNCLHWSVFGCGVILHGNHKNLSLLTNLLLMLTTISQQQYTLQQYSFVPFYSAQNDESADMNCLVFWAHCKIGKFLMKRQVYNKGIFTKYMYFEYCFSKMRFDITDTCSWYLHMHAHVRAHTQDAVSMVTGFHGDWACGEQFPECWEYTEHKMVDSRHRPTTITATISIHLLLLLLFTVSTMTSPHSS